MNEALIRTEEEQVGAMRALVESEMETSEVKDEFSLPCSSYMCLSG